MLKCLRVKYMKDCIMINVNCFKNKSLEIECEYIGFKFCVEKEKLEDMLDFINEKIAVMNMPLDHISLNEEVDVKFNVLWGKEQISACLEKHEEELVKEYLKQYPRTKSSKR